MEGRGRGRVGEGGEREGRDWRRGWGREGLGEGGGGEGRGRGRGGEEGGRRGGRGGVHLGLRGVKLHQEADLVSTGLGREQDSGCSGCCKDWG